MSSGTAVSAVWRRAPARLVVPVAALLLSLVAGALATLTPSLAFFAVLAGLGGVSLLAVWEMPAVSFTLLLAGLVLHPFVFRVLAAKVGLSASLLVALGLWKELLIAVLIAYVLLLVLSRGIPTAFRLRRSDLFLVGFAALGVLGVLFSKTPVAAAYALRNYLEPFTIYMLARTLPLKTEQVRQLLAVLVTLTVLNSLFGVVQATVLGLPFYYSWGFLTPEGQLPTAFRIGASAQARGAGTLTGPNELGIYLVMMIAVVVFFFEQRGGSARRFVRVALVTLLLGLVFTFSRSALLGLGIGLVLPLAWRRLWRGISVSWMLLLGVSALLALGIVWQAGLVDHLARTVTLEDSSAQGHLDSWAASVALMLEAPFGVGLGLVGARAGRFGSIEQRYHTESTYFQVGMELGWLGLCLYLGLLLMLGLELWLVVRRGPDIGRRLGQTALAALAATSVAFLFLPLAQTLAAASGLWLLVGLAQRPMLSWTRQAGEDRN